MFCLREDSDRAPLRLPRSAHPWFSTALSLAARDMTLQHGGGIRDHGERICQLTGLAPFLALRRTAARWRRTPGVRLAGRLYTRRRRMRIMDIRNAPLL